MTKGLVDVSLVLMFSYKMTNVFGARGLRKI